MSQSTSAYDRIEGDRYYTPAWVTEALLGVETFDGPTIDPAAGAGHIVDVFSARGLMVEGSDIAPDAIHVHGPLDYLTAVPGTVRNIVTNPPYGKGGRLAVSFIKPHDPIPQYRSEGCMTARVERLAEGSRRMTMIH